MFVNGKTGTYADTLQAIGVASLLRECGHEKVVVRGAGGRFEIAVARSLDEDEWKPPSAGFPYVWERSKEPEPEHVRLILDYEGEKEKDEAWKAYEKGLKKSKGKGRELLEEQGLEEPARPSRDLVMAKMLASMRKGWSSDRDIAKWVEGDSPEVMPFVWSSLGVDGHKRPKAPDVSSTQMLNPIAGKGIHASKTNWKSPGSLPDVLIDPFAEWMKLRGMWLAMLPYRSGDDFKFFVIEPIDIAVGALGKLRLALADIGLYGVAGGIRLDIEATLRLTELLIRHSDVYRGQDADEIQLSRRRPKELIAGLRQAFFKSLGTAAALMNDALLPLPDWFAIESRQDCDEYFTVIEEAVGSVRVNPRTWGCLGSLDEGKSDEGAILQCYREWLLSSEVSDLLEFHYRYAVKMMQKLASKPYAQAFSTAYLDLLLKKGCQEKDVMKEILDNEGFQSIARAVRNTTIYAVGMKNSSREPRFGLAQEWKQKMKGGKTELAAAVAEYVQSQNWEVAHRLKGKGHTVTTEELNGFFSLLDKHDAQLVGSLLLAYGYARAPKIEMEGTEQ
jgi:hypothetical protein